MKTGNIENDTKEMETKFIESCIKLGAELLEKEELTDVENNFITNLDNIVDNYVFAKI